MGDIYTPPRPHRCPFPEDRRPLGSIWRCDTCGVYWIFRYTESSFGPTWTPVRWWDFAARKRIRAYERGLQKHD